MNKTNNFFIDTADNICSRKNIKIDFSNLKTDLDVYKSLVDHGIEEKDIIQSFAAAIGLPFSDIRDKDFSKDFIKEEALPDVVKNRKIFPYVEDKVLHVAISDTNNMSYASDIISTPNFDFVFCFQFIINEKFNEIKEKINGDDNGISETEKDIAVFNNDRKNILLATGEEKIDLMLEESEQFNELYKPVAVVQNRDMLFESCEQYTPDILFVGDGIGGKSSLTTIILKLRLSMPDMRIIYLTGDIDPQDSLKKQAVGILASSGVYDIINKSDISIAYLKEILTHPRKYSDVEDFINEVKDGLINKKPKIKLYVPEEVEDDNSVVIYDNLYNFTDAHGGSGKSFVLENTAIAIATKGIPTKNGTKPKVAIIDLDFEGFNTSKFFNMLSDKKNIYTAIEEVNKILNRNGSKKENVSDVDKKHVNENIRMMFRPTKKFSNIYMLPGSSIVYHSGDKELMTPFSLTYIIETVVEDFDVIFIDINSDIENGVTYPLLKISNDTFFIVDMNWNSFNNTTRMLTYLKDEDIYSKEQSKFVLNKAVDIENSYVGIKDIENGLGVNFSAIIPVVDPTLMFNLSCKSESVMKSDDPSLNEIKYYFLKFADSIYPIKNFDIIDSQMSKKAKFKLTKNPERYKLPEKENKTLNFEKALKSSVNDIKKFIEFKSEKKE